MPKAIAHGCSFTAYKWPCWPKFVPWFNGGVTMLNKGRSGSGNETISRAAINSAMKHKQIDHMYIMWSGTDRYEVITKDKGADEVQARVTYYVWDEDFNGAPGMVDTPKRTNMNTTGDTSGTKNTSTTGRWNTL